MNGNLREGRRLALIRYSPTECLRRIMDLYSMSDTLELRAGEVKICLQYSESTIPAFAKKN